MGALNQIEIYFKQSNPEKFVGEIEEILKFSNISEHNAQDFIKTIVLNKDSSEYYFEYKTIKLSFPIKEYSEELIWDLDIFNWSNETYTYEIRLGIASETLVEMKEGQPIHYNTKMISQIERLMEEINKIVESQIILFTDEVSEGQFVNELKGKDSDLSFLFDIALISRKINWDYNQTKYDLIEIEDQNRKYISRHAYMTKRESN